MKYFSYIASIFFSFLMAAQISSADQQSGTSTSKDQPEQQSTAGESAGNQESSPTSGQETNQSGTTGTTTEGQGAAQQQEQGQKAEHVVVSFSKGSAQLTDEAKKKVSQALTTDASKKAQVKIAVWSDKDWTPETKEDQFSEQDKKLAEQRGQALKEYITTSSPQKEAEVFTMTENIGFLAKLFNTDEAEIKSIFAKKGQQAGGQESDNRAATLLRDSGGPGKAVIIITK